MWISTPFFKIFYDIICPVFFENPWLSPPLQVFDGIFACHSVIRLPKGFSRLGSYAVYQTTPYTPARTATQNFVTPLCSLGGGGVTFKRIFCIYIYMYIIFANGKRREPLGGNTSRRREFRERLTWSIPLTGAPAVL